MTVTADLISQADDLLTKGSPQHNRMSSWVARAALEQVVTNLLELKGYEPGAGTMRSKLTCLESAYTAEPDIIEAAEYAWAALSQASHQHAFQLDPSASECRHLIEVVQQLDQRARNP